MDSLLVDWLIEPWIYRWFVGWLICDFLGRYCPDWPLVRSVDAFINLSTMLFTPHRRFKKKSKVHPSKLLCFLFCCIGLGTAPCCFFFFFFPRLFITTWIEIFKGTFLLCCFWENRWHGVPGADGHTLTTTLPIPCLRTSSRRQQRPNAFEASEKPWGNPGRIAKNVLSEKPT